MRFSPRTLAVLAALGWSSPALGAPFLSYTDSIIAIDRDAPISLSSYPGNEPPVNALDGDFSTKYLNFGKLGAGLMVKPASGPSIIQSMKLTTANDAVERDPASWAIYGTNDSVDLLAPGVDNGNSLIANWSLISQGSVALPAARFTDGPVLSFANATSYATYRIVFPTVKNAGAANSMQIADINLFTSGDGSGTSVVSPFDEVAAFHLPAPDSRYNPPEAPKYVLDGTGPNLDTPVQSSYPGNEAPPNAIDGTDAKYLNFGRIDSGFIVTPSGGSSLVRSFRLDTANDAIARDPAAWALYGTNAAITSTDNSRGLGEAWTLIGSGDVALPDDRNVQGPVVTVTNATNYTSYKMLFTNLKDPAAANSMQISEASFFNSVDGTGTSLLTPTSTILAVDGTIPTGLETKYLNFGKENSGLIITPAAGAKVLTSFQITTANDGVERDPASYELYGTNATIVSTDNSQGTGEAWTLISQGALALPDDRLTDSAPVTFANATSYKSYKLVFPTVKDAVAANSMQISGLQFFDSSVVQDVDLDNDGDVDGNDFLLIQRTNPSLISAWKTQFGSAVGAAGGVPEPACGVMALVACICGLSRRRKAPRRS